MADLDSGIQYLKGVGPKRAEALAERGLVTVADLLYHLPIRYEDRSRLMAVSMLKEGEAVTVSGRIVQATLNRTRRRGFTVYQALLADGTGTLRLVFFNQPYLKETLPRETHVFVHGKLGRSRITGAVQMTNPAFEIVEPGDDDAWDSLVPVHPSLPGFTPRGTRRLLRAVVDGLPATLPATLPPGVAERQGLMDARRALLEVHFPRAGADAAELTRRASEAHRRLIFDELFAMCVAFRLRRRDLGRRSAAHRYRTTHDVGDRLRALLPFRLTPGQRQAFREIVADLRRDVPMARLLQGDVGSGKTIVALLAMLLAAESGLQAALMAPTEILAEQHARAFRRLLETRPKAPRREVALLTSSVPAAERRRVAAGLADGSLPLVVGTHALLTGSVAFASLSLVVIDEQHRFGVEQRDLLGAKGDAPDVLVMSATPIPRTLALAVHGDLDVSVIGDRPPGRQPVRTLVREERSRTAVRKFLAKEIAEGRQAYVVHPLIDETADADVLAATRGAEELSKALPRARVALLHGRLPADVRERVMREFAAGDVDVLVSTTVIEVGVDVPNATVMVIEGADRFGLAQLHQLRGRVGRGAHASTCILVRSAKAEAGAKTRLDLVASTEDGFVLAEADLAARGAGQFFGARQAGLSDLRLADPLRDRDVLLAARDEAARWVDSLSDKARREDPLVRAIEARWSRAVARTRVG